jgi:ribosomal protein L37AE/L43A
MPKREDEFWAAQQEKEKGSCPRCGSTNISYNEKFQSWKCNKCEYSFNLENEVPGIIEEKEKGHPVTKTNDENHQHKKAWFGTEYFDKKTRKWKKPKYKKSTVIASIIALLAVIIVVVVVILYGFVFT